MTSDMRESRAVGPSTVTPPHLGVFSVVLALALVAAGCAQGGADPTTTTIALAPTSTSTTTTTSPGEAPDPVAEPIEREVWQYLGVVIPSEPYAGLADFKVGRLGDGTYIGMAHQGFFDAVGGQAIFASTDLLQWEFLAVSHFLGDSGGFHGAFLSLDDGSMRMFWVEPGEGIASATTFDGVSWTRDPGWLLTHDAFDHEVFMQHLTIVPRAEGGWRMYVQVVDCETVSLHGDPSCEAMYTDVWGGCGCLLNPIYSAVSDDMLEWTLEPGIRHVASSETGSFHHPHAWVDDDGRVRISSQMEVLPRLEGYEWRMAFGSISSDDGLDFHTYVEQSVPLVDPFVVRTDDGRLLAFGSPGDASPTEPGNGIRAWQLTTVTWEFDHPLRTPLPGQGAAISEDPNEGRHLAVCFQIDVRGEGRFTLDVRGIGQEYVPASAAPDLYDLSHDVIEAPATFYLTEREARAPGLPEVEWHEIPSHVVATDENGVQWWQWLAPLGEEPPGDSCGP